MHDGIVVIRRIEIIRVLLLKVVSRCCARGNEFIVKRGFYYTKIKRMKTLMHSNRTLWNVFPVDADILVPVAPGVLVVETKSVEELVFNDPVINATIH